MQGEGDDDRGRVEEDGRNNLYIYIYNKLIYIYNRLIYIYIYNMRRASRKETELGESIRREVLVCVFVSARACAHCVRARARGLCSIAR